MQTHKNYGTLPSSYKYHSDERLSHVNFISVKILKITQALDPNKAHGPDGVSIKMLKLSRSSILKPLSLIFCKCSNCGTFKHEWKKSQHCSGLQKNSRQIVNNYRPASLRLIC